MPKMDMKNIKQRVNDASYSAYSWVTYFGWLAWATTKKYWKIPTIVLLCVGIFFCGWYSCVRHNANVKEIEKPVEVPVVQKVIERVEVPIEVPVQVKGETEVRYVEKESPKDSDVNVTQKPSKVTMTYNDKQYEFDTVANETHKFDKGKLVVEQESKTTLDVTPIVKREVDIAVKETATEMSKQKEIAVKDAVKEEKKHSRRNAVESFFLGAGAAALILAL